MEISEELLGLFSAEVEQRDGTYVFEVPEREIRLGDLRDDAPYRVAVLSAAGTDRTDSTASSPAPARTRERERSVQSPPVAEGERRTVEIADIGEQGDGIARVERGYVVIVPDTDQSERVEIEITDVRTNVAFAEVVERVSYYE